MDERNSEDGEEDKNTNEEQLGLLSDNIPRNGEGQYLGRQRCKAYTIYDACIYTGKKQDSNYKKYRVDVTHRVLQDFNYDIKRDTMTTAKIGLNVCKALFRNQPLMEDEVIQDLVGEIDHFWQTYNKGAPLRPERGDDE